MQTLSKIARVCAAVGALALAASAGCSEQRDLAPAAVPPPTDKPLGEWPVFDQVNVCTTTDLSGNPTPVMVWGTSGGSTGVQGEEIGLIHNGKLQLFIHSYQGTWLCEKTHAQDVWSGYSRQWNNAGQTATPQVWPATGTLIGWHTDTPAVLRHPKSGEWLCYNTTWLTMNQGQAPTLLPTATTGRLMALTVFTRSSAPAPDSPWSWTNGTILPIDQSWETPFIKNHGGGVLEGIGGMSEPSAIWVPKKHPTQGWDGFVRLFYRALTATTINPTTQEGSGWWKWSISYADSADGKTGWVKAPNGPFWDPSNSASPASKWAQAPPNGYGFRGSWQPSFTADPRANGVHMVALVSNPNGSGSQTRGVVCHYFSGGELDQGGWGDRWTENPSIDPVNSRSGVVFWPGKVGSTGISATGFYRTPTLVIDDRFPQTAGQSGGRYLLILNGGETIGSTGLPRATYIATARRP